MGEQIREGTADGLIEFVDYLIDKGYVPRAAGTNWKGAARTVLTRLEGEDFGSKNVSEISIDDYLARFEVVARGHLKQESAQTYAKRFRTALDAYVRFLTDENWTPPAIRPAASKRTGAPSVGARGGAGAPGNELDVGIVTGDHIDYPFPLRSGEMARVRLPARLDQGDAERLATFIRTLVFEPQKRLEAGEDRRAA